VTAFSEQDPVSHNSPHTSMHMEKKERLHARLLQYNEIKPVKASRVKHNQREVKISRGDKRLP
jgi:hypothetical protein